MFKKLVSKALLSVVMDKSARDNLDIKKKIKQARKAEAPPTPSEVPPTAEPDPASLASMSHEETRQLIVDSLKAAEEELGRKPEMTSEREALIEKPWPCTAQRPISSTISARNNARNCMFWRSNP